MIRTRRLLGIAALGAAAASILAIPGAGAQAVSYGATSEGTALELSLFGQGLTAAHSQSAVTSEGPAASADGAGILNPLSPVGVTSASVEGADGTDGSPDETCEGELPEIPGLSLEVACSASVAAIAGGDPASGATARVSTLEANPIQEILDTPLSEVVAPVEDGLDQLLDGLSPVFGPIDEASELGLEDTLGDLFDELLGGSPLAALTIGDTEVVTQATDEAVTAECLASGGVLDILDPPTEEIPPVVSIEIGDAATSVTAATDGSEPTAAADPSILTLHVPSSPALDGTAVGPGQEVVIPLPAPLGNVVISVAGGTTGEDADGNTFARASAVRIEVFQGSEELMGGIVLSLADCLSVAGVNVAAPPTTSTSAPVTTPPLLPRTGSDGPNELALAAAVGFAGLGLALLRRTRAN